VIPYLGSVDSARFRRRQKNDIQKSDSEPVSLEDYGYYFNKSKHRKKMK
jgi:hypothetical protein